VSQKAFTIATTWSICFNTVVRVDILGEVDNECTSHYSIVLAICVPKIIKFGGDLTTF